jgi:hypothetical protein
MDKMDKSLVFSTFRFCPSNMGFARLDPGLWEMANCLRGIYPYINRGIIFQGPGIFFKLARCGYTLRITSQTSYSPEYTTPTQQIVEKFCPFPPQIIRTMLWI